MKTFFYIDENGLANSNTEDQDVKFTQTNVLTGKSRSWKGSTRFPIKVLEEGHWHLLVEASDAVGNIGSFEFYVINDTKAPEITDLLVDGVLPSATEGVLV
jgi:hypothetical protein